MKKPTKFTAFVRPAGSYTADEQREIIAAWLKANGCTLETEYDAGEFAGARDEWVTRTRKTEGAIIAALWLIGEPRGNIGRPTTDFIRALSKIEHAAALVVEAETGIASTSKQWADRKAEAQDFIAAGKRRLSKRQQRVMAAARAKKAVPGGLERWRDPANKRRYDKWHAHWTSRKFKSGAEAYNAIPEDVRDDIGGLRMMYKIFGPRHLGDVRVGGRPPKGGR